MGYRLSYSKIKDLDKGLHYFYKKHIAKTIKQEITDALVIGSAVDAWLTKSRKNYERTYTVKDRRTKDETYEYQLTPAMKETIERICEAVTATTAYKELKRYKKQHKIIMPCNIGIFRGISGIPDFYQINGDTATICDLKTTTADRIEKWRYACADIGYFMQLAVYKELVRYKHPEINKFKFFHLVCTTDKDYCDVKIFKISEERIKEESLTLKEKIAWIRTLKKSDFRKKTDAEFNKAEEI